jgi:hypothetical protein
MSYIRIALAAVAATITDFLYGFLVYGNLLTSSFAAQAGIYRGAEAQMANMPIGAFGVLLAMIAVSTLYARWCERGTVTEGVSFGLLIALFAIGTCVLVNYATIAMTAQHAAMMGIAALVEWLVVGVVLSLVYRPARPRGTSV